MELTIERFKELNHGNTNLGDWKWEGMNHDYFFEDRYVQKNFEIAKSRQEPRTAYEVKTDITMGDAIILPNDEIVYVCHVWDDHVQTTGTGSYYICQNGYMDFSGGLDSGLKRKDLIPVDDSKPRRCWFFENDRPRAHSAIQTEVYVRVWKAKKSADFKGVPQMKGFK